MKRRPDTTLIVTGFICLLGAMITIWYRSRGNVPILFCGKIVDITGHGMPGVAVDLRVTQMPFFSLPNVPYDSERRLNLTAITDSEGKFDVRSRGLELEVIDIRYPGWSLWNAGAGMEKAFSYNTRRYGTTPIHDDPSRP
jgi:hypothetical protein